VDIRGRVLASFTDIGLPAHLSIARGRVLVADYDNDRILQLSSDLKLQCVLIDKSHSQVNLEKPERLCYNELKSQLYVVHSGDVISLFTVQGRIQ